MTREAHVELVANAFRILGTSLVQILIFIFLYESAVEFYVANVAPMTRVFGFEMQMDHAMHLFSLLVIAGAFAQVFFESAVVRLASPLVSTGIWIGYWANTADDVPNRFLLLSVLGTMSIFSGLILTYRDGRPGHDLQGYRPPMNAAAGNMNKI